jgi:hypothetical protein
MESKIMHWILKLLLCICLLAVTTLCQEKVTKMMAGPKGDRFGIVVAFIEVTDQSFKTQTLIFDVNQVKKKNEQPTSFYVDLTSTVRSATTGDKAQKILVIRWEDSGVVEVKCEGGKWAKETAGPELDNIVETVRAVVQHVPLDTKGDPVEFTLPKAIEQKVISILDSLETSKLVCIRNGS